MCAVAWLLLLGRAAIKVTAHAPANSYHPISSDVFELFNKLHVYLMWNQSAGKAFRQKAVHRFSTTIAIVQS